MPFLLIDKPKGISSFRVLQTLQDRLGKKKMGHAGTLDPLASGLLIVATEHETKQLHNFLKLPKEYIAEVRLGVATETGDDEGVQRKKRPVPNRTEKEIEKILHEMTGKIDLPVPLYSAVKKKGKPLYRYARKGKSVELPVKTMEIMEGELLEKREETLIIRWKVGSGTYIRTLAEELGKRLDTVAMIVNLRRTAIGDFSIYQAKLLEDF